DLTTRTLVVHVGGWNSGGTLTAHLSDGSASDYTNVVTNTSAQYDGNYTLIYRASSAGQTLTVRWTMSSGAGNVALNAAALSAPSGSVTATGGTPQSTAINTAFATALQATVRDASNNPVSGVTVTFTAPGSGASANFSGSLTATATTNSSGVATASALTANGTAGSYTVTGSASGVPTPANYNLTNTGGTSGGSLTGSSTSATGLVNLTTEGPADWIHWGDASLNRKAGVTAQISNYTIVGSGTAFSYGNDLRP